MVDTTPRDLPTPSTTVESARRDMYRQHILAAAELEFSKAGFGASKVKAIAKAAGVSLTTLYKYFDSKDELWDALNTQRMTQFVEAVKERTSSITSPLESILAGVRAEMEFFAEQSRFLELHLNDGLSWGTAWTSPGAGRGTQRDAWRAGMDMLTRTAEAATAAGEIHGLRPSLVASIVISTEQVWLADWVAHGRDRPIDAVANELVDRLRKLLT